MFRLETQRLILKPHSLANAEKMNAWSNDPELLFFDDDLPEPYRVSPMERTIEFLERNADPSLEDETIHWAIHLKGETEGSGVEGLGLRVRNPEQLAAEPIPPAAIPEPQTPDPILIGYCMLAFIDRYHGKCRFGMTIGDKSQWGRGFGREVLAAALKFAFHDLSLNRVQSEIYDFNERSIRLFGSVGFRREGVLRESVLKKGRLADEYVYGMLKADWAAGLPDLITP